LNFDSVQTVFNIFDPLPLDCLIPACQEHNVAVIARCVLDEGCGKKRGLEGNVFVPISLISNSHSHPLYKIVIDPGHGGIDVGTVGINGLFEKDFTLSTALKVKRLMDMEPAVKVYLTRTDDTFIPNDHRITMANQLSADLYLSIHANMDANPKTKGTETFFNRKNSLFFAQIVQKHVQKATGFPDRHVEYENFRVIKNTFMPAALVEVGFLSNAAEEKALFMDQNQGEIAAAMVDGIKESLGMK
jgi:N-acetylmuramoyl-L-alanine amidase